MTVENAKEVNQLSAQLGYPLSLGETIHQMNKILESEDHVALVAAIDKKIVGWIHAFIAIRMESKPFIEIGGLVVDENFRKHKIGSKLVGAIADWCRKEKIDTLRVRCNTKRKETHLFYQKLNFNETKEQKIFQLIL